MYLEKIPHKALGWNGSDGEGRKRGEQLGLDKLFLSQRKTLEKEKYIKKKL